jgi:hypothetical protein
MLIFTANGHRGFTYESADEMLRLTEVVHGGRATKATLDRMMELLAGARPISASMMATARPVEPAKSVGELADRFWSKRKAGQNPAPVRQQPQPEPVARSDAKAGIDEAEVYRKWNSIRKAGSLGGVPLAPITGGR